MRLLLVRHAQTGSNVLRLLDTAAPGARLTTLGAAQANALPAAFAGVPIDAIYASTLVRTQETARPLAESLGLTVTVRDGLREIGAGELELQGDEPSIVRYLETAFSWTVGDVAARMPGAENGVEVLSRFDGVVAEIAAAGTGTAVVVSHGAMIRVWTAARARNLEPAFAAAHALENTAVIVVDGDPVGGWSVSTWAGEAVDPGAGPPR